MPDDLIDIPEKPQKCPHPPGPEREAWRLQRLREGKKQQKERRLLAEEKKKAYATTSPQEWLERFGEEKPKIGIVDAESAVRILSKRMTGLALHTLAHICEHSDNHAARVSAAKEILDRGWGKASRPKDDDIPVQAGSEIIVTFGDQALLAAATAPNGADHEDEDDAETQTDEPAVQAGIHR